MLNKSRIVMFIAGLFVTTLIVFVMTGFVESTNHFVNDPARRQAFSVQSGIKNPTGVTVSVQGYVDGVARIYITSWNFVEVSGHFEDRFYQDWFESNFEIIYDPINVTHGNVEIHSFIR